MDEDLGASSQVSLVLITLAKCMNLTRCKPFLGCYVEISIDADAEFEELAELSNIGFDAIELVSESMSYHDAESELSKVNRYAVSRPVVISDELTEVVKFSLELAARTEGLFDVTVAPYLVSRGLLPDHHDSVAEGANWKSVQLKGNEIHFLEPLLIDLGGVAKGYAVDLAMQRVLEMNPNAVVVINAGGDLKMSHWQGESAHIHHADDNGKLERIEMQQSALCSSSYHYVETGRRSETGHIIRPDSGLVQPLAHSVSVFSPCCMYSDALTKVTALAPELESEIFSHYQAVIVHAVNDVTS